MTKKHAQLPSVQRANSFKQLNCKLLLFGNNKLHVHL